MGGWQSSWRRVVELHITGQANLRRGIHISREHGSALATSTTRPSVASEDSLFLIRFSASPMVSLRGTTLKIRRRKDLSHRLWASTMAKPSRLRAPMSEAEIENSSTESCGELSFDSRRMIHEKEGIEENCREFAQWMCRLRRPVHGSRLSSVLFKMTLSDC